MAHAQRHGLAMGGTPTQNQIPLKWLVLPLTDAPHYSIMPDLGQIIHHVLARDPIPCSLSAVVEQSIPCFRHSSRGIAYHDSQGVLISLAMGLLLGLYQGSGIKKPGFRTRAVLFAHIHRLLVASPEIQTKFCSENEEILLLACMEYLARVPAMYMPVQNKLLAEENSASAGFFKRIPSLCDELRQWLDEYQPETKTFWDGIRTSCASRVERVSRLKRSSSCSHHPTKISTGAKTNISSHASLSARDISAPSLAQTRYQNELEACWNVPMLHGVTADEYRLFGSGLGIPGIAIQQIQQTIQILPLPGNLKRMQLERLQATGPAMKRSSYLQTRWYICTQCMITSQKQQHHHAKLRLDTLSHRLVCATCLSPDPVIAVNMVGRIMVFHKTHYYLCPRCSAVHAYTGGNEQPWAPDGGACCHTQRPSNQHQLQPQHHTAGGGAGHTATAPIGKHARRKETCCVCSEHALIYTARRVNHLTGEMTEFHYCQRHVPRTDTARKCVNARQLMNCVSSPHKSRGHHHARLGTGADIHDY